LAEKWTKLGSRQETQSLSCVEANMNYISITPMVKVTASWKNQDLETTRSIYAAIHDRGMVTFRGGGGTIDTATFYIPESEVSSLRERLKPFNFVEVDGLVL